MLNVPLNIDSFETLNKNLFNLPWNNDKSSFKKRRARRDSILNRDYKSLRIFLYFDLPSISLLVIFLYYFLIFKNF